MAHEMNPREIEDELVAFARNAGVDLYEAPPVTGIDRMLRFYAERRAEGCDLAADEDMLLFQWGVYDFGDGSMFEIDLTRQVMLPDEVDDDAILQLHLTYRYPQSSAVAAIPRGDELAEFEQYIRSSPALLAVVGVPPRDVSIQFHPV